MSKKQTKATLGRPKKDIDLLPEDWQEQVLNRYKNGASNVEIKAYLYDVLGTFSDSLWARWLIEEPIFSSTIKKGLAFSEAWWEQQGRENLKEVKFQTALYQINMRNRFKWDEKKEEVQEVKPTEFHLVLPKGSKLVDE